MRTEHDPERIAAFQTQDIILTIGRGDPSFENNQELSATLWQKKIGNALRVSDGHAHDWPYWEKVIRRYIGGHD
jgi:esterase/lipase superfamily enzyme